VDDGDINLVDPVAILADQVSPGGAD